MESAAGEMPASVEFEISTQSADALRARLVVVGELTARTVPLLTSAVATHLRAGRRYLRVDVTRSSAADTAVLDALTDLHERATALGGMVVFDASPATDALTSHVAALRAHG